MTVLVLSGVRLAGIPAEHSKGGLCLKQTGEPQLLIKHFLEHGILDSSVTQHLTKLVLVSGTSATRYQEKQVGTQSRLSLDWKWKDAK